MPDFFYLRTLLLEIVLRSKFLNGNLSRCAGIHLIENYQEMKQRILTLKLSRDETTNFHAELYFHWKRLDQIKINLPLCKYIKENNTLRIALQRKFIDKLTKNAYIKGPTKRQCITIKEAFLKNYDDIDDNYNSVH